MIPPIYTFFFFNDTATTEIYTLSLHDALPIYSSIESAFAVVVFGSASSIKYFPVISPFAKSNSFSRSEEHTSELQSPCNLVCRLLLEKKNHPANSTPHAVQLVLLVSQSYSSLD